jgi:hypothetical protein
MENETDKFYVTGSQILHTLSSFCLGWTYDDFIAIFDDTEKGSDYYWNLFEKVRMTFPENGADMLGFIYELEDAEKAHLFSYLFNTDVKF